MSTVQSPQAEDEPFKEVFYISSRDKTSNNWSQECGQPIDLPVSSLSHDYHMVLVTCIHHMPSFG